MCNCVGNVFLEGTIMWYEFNQNNSGGTFDEDNAQGIGPFVWVEAKNANQANDRAEEIGIYFNGCEKGVDCNCCGDRWYSQWEDSDGETDVPVNEYQFRWSDTVYAHGLDGTIYRLTKKEAYAEGHLAIENETK